jgi:hypothetical protein
MSISCDIRFGPRFTCMNKRPVFVVLAVFLAACGTDESVMTRHQVCERLATAACDRIAACEPLVAPTGCTAREMTRCCPDGICAEPVIATEERVAVCEAAITSMSCSQLTDGDLPPSCEDLTDPLPMTPDAGMPGDGRPPGDGPNMGDGILEVTWDIYAGGSSLQCSQFHNTDKIRIIATPPGGTAITRDFTCIDFSALTTLPVGVYSIVAQARSGSTVVQQTAASTVGVYASGSSTSFTFSVTTSFGSYCSQLATTVCNACFPTDTTCTTELINECCANDGLCNNAALADSQRFPQCLSAYGTGSYCTGTAPTACQGAIQVF